MKRLVTAIAVLSSLAALIVTAGGGLALLAIENSGERGMGALLALGGGMAFAAVMLLVFAREKAFGAGLLRGVAVAAAILGAIPVAVLAFVAIRFAGLPIGSPMPLIDWTVLAGGVFLAFGAVAILALGHRRSQESGITAEEPKAELPAAEEPPIIHMQQIRHAQQQLRSVFDADARSGQPMDIDEGVRVRRV